MPLQCTDYVPNETHQEQPSAYANTTGKPLSSSCRLKQFYYHASASLFVQKSDLKRNKISPSYFLKVFYKLVPSWSKVFIIWTWLVCLSPGAALPHEQEFIIPSSDCNLCHSKSISSSSQQLYMQKFTNTPWYIWLYHPSHIIFWLVLLFLIQPT